MTREFLDFAALLDKGDRPRVKFNEIAEFPVALPPLIEQQRIVAKVDGLTERTSRARMDLDRIPKLVARYKQQLLALAFSGELTAAWRLAQGQANPRKGGMPEGWQVKMLDEISEIRGGIQVGKKRAADAELFEVAYLRVANVQRS